MGTPAAVRRQSEEADALIAAAAKGNTGEPAPTVQDQPAPAPAAAPVEPAPTPEAALEAEKKNAETWQRRYTVLQGKYDAEVPRLTEQLRAANEKIAELNQKLTQAPPPVQVSDEDRQKLVDRFGEDMVDMVVKMVQAGVQSGIAPIKDKLSTVETSVDATAKAAQKTASQQYWDEVDRLLAEHNLVFDKVNNDPGFIDWLSEQDGFSGLTRLQSLENAQGKRDAKRTAQFFITYAKGLPKGDAPPLEQHIQPDPGTPGGDPLNINKGKTWTRAEIDKFYADKRTGKYKGKEAEADRIEADILAATSEGRIRR